MAVNNANQRSDQPMGGEQAEHKRSWARLFFGPRPKTGRQRKAHARASVLVSKLSLVDDPLEFSQLTPNQKARRRRQIRRAKARAAMQPKTIDGKPAASGHRARKKLEQGRTNGLQWQTIKTTRNGYEFEPLSTAPSLGTSRCWRVS